MLQFETPFPSVVDIVGAQLCPFKRLPLQNGPEAVRLFVCGETAVYHREQPFLDHAPEPGHVGVEICRAASVPALCQNLVPELFEFRLLRTAVLLPEFRRHAFHVPEEEESVYLFSLFQYGILHFYLGNAAALLHVFLNPRVFFRKMPVEFCLLFRRNPAIPSAEKAYEERFGPLYFIHADFDDLAGAGFLFRDAPSQVKHGEADSAFLADFSDSRKYFLREVVAFFLHVRKSGGQENPDFPVAAMVQTVH